MTEQHVPQNIEIGMSEQDEMVAWLRVQLAADEQHAMKDLHVLDHASALGNWQGRYGHNLSYSEIWADDGILFRVETPRHQADVMAIARLVKLARGRAEERLAEIEAKRRLLRQFELRRGAVLGLDGMQTGGAWDDMIRLLALPYADREGYREEWRP